MESDSEIKTTGFDDNTVHIHGLLAANVWPLMLTLRPWSRTIITNVQVCSLRLINKNPADGER